MCITNKLDKICVRDVCNDKVAESACASFCLLSSRGLDISYKGTPGEAESITLQP